MKPADPLARLLRAAVSARPPAVEGSDPLLNAGSLLQQAEPEWARRQVDHRSVFRVGLATACLLLMLTLLLSARHLQQTSRDVFATSEMVLTRILIP